MNLILCIILFFQFKKCGGEEENYENVIEETASQSSRKGEQLENILKKKLLSILSRDFFNSLRFKAHDVNGEEIGIDTIPNHKGIQYNWAEKYVEILLKHINIDYLVDGDLENFFSYDHDRVNNEFAENVKKYYSENMPNLKIIFYTYTEDDFYDDIADRKNIPDR
ncbi:hypothetical protein EDEG_01263 [Edhazardia aedis USNM 41457]|uniref:Uncharacterized protein n=1 Tax=Edhazardia aedis (strain USNM 41457) TaxID=1003232 RepID=J9DT99_EDHAE|nr:hypothetical protein EDEG_01263 [Edhazardia aedis USNM 41457]|eukprot:EJW04522.1 hypothetical protein EDEG_01263 [Edhazardia aedis USNM 41457]